MNTKNLTLINIALIIAVLILFYLQFSTKSSDSNKETPAQTENEELVATDIPNSTLQAANESSSSFDFSTLKIAYVNSDTVSTYYSFAKDVQSSLLKKQKSAENQVKNKYKDYQK